MLLRRFIVFVILFANGIQFYNSGLVFDMYLLVSMFCNVTCTCRGHYCPRQVHVTLQNIDTKRYMSNTNPLL